MPLYATSLAVTQLVLVFLLVMSAVVMTNVFAKATHQVNVKLPVQYQPQVVWVSVNFVVAQGTYHVVIHSLVLSRIHFLG